MIYNPRSMRFWKLAALALLAACVTAPQQRVEPIPADWLSVPHAVEHPELSFDGGFLIYKNAAPAPTAIKIVKTAKGAKLVNGDKDLTPEFLAIDSFDLSQARQEIVFSAKRTTNFDAGLVAAEGSDIHWIPNDPADEVSVQWAPKGNRVSYIVHTPSGDFLRVVQITTSAQSTVEFPNGRIVARAWDAGGQKYAVSWETFDASQRVETMEYDGRERHMNASPTSRLTGFATEFSNGALIVRPETMHYGEKLPLVVWRTNDHNRWSDARAQLFREAHVAIAIVEHDPDAKFWDDMRLHPWIDLTRVFVVNAPAPAGATSIRGALDVGSGHYRVEGRDLLVPVDVVESFAAGNIAYQLKGNPPAHGR